MHPDFQTARDLLQRAVADKVFPAAVVEVGTSRQQLWREGFGRLSYSSDAPLTQPDTIFDLASLTKVLSTTPLVMRMVERGGMTLDDSVTAHLPVWAMRHDSVAVTIRDLLSHCSGLPGYASLFRDHSGHMAFEQAICGMAFEYPPRSASVYSDLGFILLGLILEKIAPLPVQFDTLMQQLGGLQELQFHPAKAWRRRIAPTRNDDWRGRMLVGEVDDNNAWALGGAAGHAGLFGTAGAVGECARHLLQILGGRRGVFREETLRAFVARRADIAGSSRALGWDTMLTTSSCGTRMSARAFGHTGFTGTSLWIDPEVDVYVVLLTNRVHPDAVDDTHIRVVRREVHDAVMNVVAGEEGA